METRIREPGWRWAPDVLGRPFRQWEVSLGAPERTSRWVDGWNVLGVRGSYRGTARSDIRVLTLVGHAVPGAPATRGRFVLQRRDGTLEWGEYQAVDRFVVTDLVLQETSGRVRTFRFASMQLDPRTRQVQRFSIGELCSDGRTLRRAVFLTRT